jgi:hypothetical protein
MSERELIELAIAETDALIQISDEERELLDKHRQTLATLNEQIPPEPEPPEPEPPEPEPEPDETVLLGQPGDTVLILPRLPTPILVVDGNGHCDLVQVSWPLSYWKWFHNADGSVYGTEVHASGQKVTLRNLTFIRDGASAPSIAIADLPFEGTAPPPDGGEPAPPDGEFEPLPPAVFPKVTEGNIAIEIEWTTPDPERIGRRGRQRRTEILSFRESDGEDLGTFEPDSPFTAGARMVRMRHADAPLYVLIVRDTSDPEHYWQVWFVNFQMWNAVPADLPGYTARIFKGDTLAASYDVPKHYWAGQWRHVNEPWPIIRMPPACVPWVMQLEAAAAKGVQPLALAPHSEVMQVRTMTKSMPDTGDRGEIGLYTEFQGEWLATGNPNAFAGMIVQDEEGACFPMGWIDEHAGRPLSLDDYPTIDAKPGSGSPYQVPEIPCELILDTGHMPGFGYLAYVATEDPWHLWLLQCNVTWALFSYHQGYRQQGKGRIGYEQTRSYFWQLRSLARAARLSPASPPAWLLGRDYFERLLENNREFFQADFIDDPAPVHAVLRQAVQAPADYEGWGNQQTAPWQEEFGVIVLAELVKIGFGWQAPLMWKADSSLARFGQRDGWPRAFGCPYRIIVNAAYGAPFAASWAEALTLNRAAGNLDPEHEGDDWVDWYNYFDYARAAHCSLAQLDLLLAETEPNLAWFAGQLSRPDAWNPWRWCFRDPTAGRRESEAK